MIRESSSNIKRKQGEDFNEAESSILPHIVFALWTRSLVFTLVGWLMY